MTTKLTADQIAHAEGLDDWQVDGDHLQATFDTGSFNDGVTLVQAIAALADDAHHHPDVLLTYPSVQVRLTTHDAGGLTIKDVDLARAISRSVRES